VTGTIECFNIGWPDPDDCADDPATPSQLSEQLMAIFEDCAKRVTKHKSAHCFINDHFGLYWEDFIHLVNGLTVIIMTIMRSLGLMASIRLISGVQSIISLGTRQFFEPRMTAGVLMME
jgi:hypothetical protein